MHHFSWNQYLLLTFFAEFFLMNTLRLNESSLGETSNLLQLHSIDFSSKFTDSFIFLRWKLPKWQSKVPYCNLHPTSTYGVSYQVMSQAFLAGLVLLWFMFSVTATVQLTTTSSELLSLTLPTMFLLRFIWLLSIRVDFTLSLFGAIKAVQL